MDKQYGGRWMCKCICGKNHVVLGINLKAGEVSSCGCQHKINASLLHLANLEGKKFCKLLVISRGNDYIDPQGNRRPQWNCICECGNQRVILASALKNGNTRSCGCLRIDDLKGIRFGRIRVLRLEYIKYKRIRWFCICDCGKECLVLAGSLKSGKTVSCGCLKESKIAVALKKYLKEKYNGISEYKRIKNPETERWLPYDIYIPSKNIYIEIQGEQHYKFVKYWHKTKENFKKNRKLDRMKRKYARKNGIYVEVDLRKIKTIKQAIEHIENKIKYH